MSISQEELNKLRKLYTLSHPARASIVKYLKRERKAYISQIARALGLSERLVSFHLSMLAGDGFVKSEYGLSNNPNPSRVVRYYELTDQVNEVLEQFIEEFK